MAYRASFSLLETPSVIPPGPCYCPIWSYLQKISTAVCTLSFCKSWHDVSCVAFVCGGKSSICAAKMLFVFTMDGRKKCVKFRAVDFQRDCEFEWSCTERRMKKMKLWVQRIFRFGGKTQPGGMAYRVAYFVVQYFFFLWMVNHLRTSLFFKPCGSFFNLEVVARVICLATFYM